MSKRTRTSVFTVTTPYHGAPQVTLMEDTWQEHIVSGHGEMADHQPTVKNALQKPKAVVSGTNEAGNVGFVSDVLSPNGSPIVVFVNPADQVVVTAGYNRGFKDLSQHVLLWPK